MASFNALDLLILALAAWRVAYFVAVESGPFALMERIRKHPRASKGLSCVYCMSVWSAAGMYLLWLTPLQPVVYVAAISGAAMMLHRYVGWNFGNPSQPTD